MNKLALTASVLTCLSVGMVQKSTATYSADELQQEGDKAFANKQYKNAAQYYLEAISIKDEDHYDLECFLKRSGVDPNYAATAYSSVKEKEEILNKVEKRLIDVAK